MFKQHEEKRICPGYLRQNRCFHSHHQKKMTMETMNFKPGFNLYNRIKFTDAAGSSDEE